MKSQQLKKPSPDSFPWAKLHLPECLAGTIQSVDPLGREIVILLPTGREVFYVPPDCPIYLRGERIKLRIAQTRDDVRVTFVREGGLLFVKKLEIWPDAGSSLEPGRVRNFLPRLDNGLPTSPLA
jgi:hypothetical protein